MTDCLTKPYPRAADATPADVYVQRFAVEFEYPVYFTECLFDPANRTLVDALTRREPARRQRMAAFVDQDVARAAPGLLAEITAYAAAYPAWIDLVAPPETAPGGEAAKNDPAATERLQQRMRALALDRHAFVAAVGGGAFLDVVGYVAATVHRGIRLVRVPTTVLAQNDSGVGVKNGINAFGLKNFLGTFAPPYAVVNDVRFLDTLHRRDKIAGMAEAVKVALIRDGAFFEWIESNIDALTAFSPAAVAHLIRRCAVLHMRQIAGAGDPFETGSARPLDYGHWAAHKLEALSRHDVRHGEAVAIGMALDARYAVAKGLLAPGREDRLCRVLERLGFRLWHPALEARAADGSLAILDGLREFQEHLGGDLTVTVLIDIGRGVEIHQMDARTVVDAIGWLHMRDVTRCG